MLRYTGAPWPAWGHRHCLPVGDAGICFEVGLLMPEVPPRTNVDPTPFTRCWFYVTVYDAQLSYCLEDYDEPHRDIARPRDEGLFRPALPGA